MSKYIEVDSFLASLTPDPITECGCPEPEFLREMADLLREAPAADVVPVVHGRWKIKTVMEYDLSYGGRIYIPEYVCGCCGHYYESYVRGDEPIMPEDADFPMYCEQCGARMDGKGGNDD